MEICRKKYLMNLCLNSLSRSEAWKHHKTVLKQFLTDFTSETSMSLALYTVLHKPIRDHIMQYILLLTKLNEVLKEVRSSYMMLLDWLMLTLVRLVGFGGGVSESKTGWKETYFQWISAGVVTSTSGVQPT